jgi:hypothetical protein
MPIEIRELVIRATVQDERPATAIGEFSADTLSEEALEQIVAECVRQVLAILAEKDSR